ncbi:MAG: DUF1015 domain-containing protein [Spirochaetota bacterium]|nr:DUF1015 domain-containing protein [Spirochaetota bacterium]
MINIIPFRGVRYNKQLVKDLNLVVTAPYDKIDDELQAEYYDRSPYNFVRLDKGREEDKYENAKRCLQGWMKDNILIRDDKPCIYYYTQEYSFEGSRKIRKGFISLLELDEFENGNVLPHEHTLSGPKKDRFDLLVSTEATFGQIFMLFSDPQNKVVKMFNEIEKNAPDIEVFDDDKNIHKVWTIDNTELIKKVQGEMKEKKIYIADGHHRYETSINYRNIQREKLGKYAGNELFNYTMCTFINMDDKEGMSILPTHRFIKNLSNFDLNNLLSVLKKEFNVKTISSLEELSKEMKIKEAEHAFGLITSKGDSLYLLTLKDKKDLDTHFPPNYSKDLKHLDVLILHKVILEDILGIDEEKLRQQTNVDYYRYKDEAFKLIKAGNYQLGFLLNATKIDEVKRVTESGKKMPQKSTDFYPKLISGLVVNYLK